MTGRRHRLNAGHQFLARLVARDLGGDRTNTRRAPSKPGFIPSGALAMLSSFIQNAHSGAGTMISAFGYVKRAVLAAQAVDMVALEWLMMTVLTAFGSIPAIRPGMLSPAPAARADGFPCR